jgi:adenosine deaminase
MMDYIEPFNKARKYGLGRTVHAGEGRSPKEIEVAINFLHAQRIGHGLTLLEDRRVLDLVREKQVTIEACITSNWHTGCISKLSDHPIKEWLSEDVRVAICSDNTLLSDTILPMEHRRAVAHCGLSYKDIQKCKQYAVEGLFRR